MTGDVCPFWVGYLLCSPIRKLWHNPKKILAPYINKGEKTLDIGCAMGFFSLSMARMVGPQGRVICIDVQEKMIRSLIKRAQQAGLYERIETQICSRDSFCLENIEEEIDFALAFAVVHELSNCLSFFSQVYRILKPAGKLLLAEPKGRVSSNNFEEYISTAQGNGFKVSDTPYIRSARAALLQKQS